MSATTNLYIDIPTRLSRRDRLWLGGAIFFLSANKDRFRRGGATIDLMLWILENNTLGRFGTDIRDISSRSGLSRKTVHETMMALREGGFVSKEKDKKSGEFNYVINFDADYQITE